MTEPCRNNDSENLAADMSSYIGCLSNTESDLNCICSCIWCTSTKYHTIWSTASPQSLRPELSVGWVDPWVGLTRGLGWPMGWVDPWVGLTRGLGWPMGWVGEAHARRAYAMLSFFIMYLVISFKTIISTSTRPTFTKFTGMVELWP